MSENRDCATLGVCVGVRLCVFVRARARVCTIFTCTLKSQNSTESFRTFTPARTVRVTMRCPKRVTPRAYLPHLARTCHATRGLTRACAIRSSANRASG